MEILEEIWKKKTEEPYTAYFFKIEIMSNLGTSSNPNF